MDLNIFSFIIIIVLMITFWSLFTKAKKIVVESCDIALDSLELANVSVAKETRILRASHDISLVKRAQELHQEASELKSGDKLVKLTTLEKELASLL